MATDPQRGALRPPRTRIEGFSLVEEDAEAVLHLGRQGEEADGVEAQVLHQAQVRGDDPLPAEMDPGHVGDTGEDRLVVHHRPHPPHRPPGTRRGRSPRAAS